MPWEKERQHIKERVEKEIGKVGAKVRGMYVITAEDKAILQGIAQIQ